MPWLAQAADGVHVYSGMLGEMPIVVEMDLSNPAEVQGRYFYQKYLTDLPIYGNLQGQDLQLTEDPDDKSVKDFPKLHLRPKGKNGWQGLWQGAQDNILAIELMENDIPAPADTAEPGWQAIYHKSLYDYLRLQGLPLKAGKIETVMGHTLQWWTEPVSNLSMFEITSGYSAEERQRINRQLRARLWDDVVNYNDCLLGSRRRYAYYNQTVTPHLLSPGVVSIGVVSRFYCGALPDLDDTPLNFDVKSGKLLTLEDVLWVGQGKVLHNDASEDPVGVEAYTDYRQKQLIPWLVDQLKAIAPQAMQKPTSEDGCDYSDPDIWKYAFWRFTPKGIYFGPSFASGLRTCRSPDWSVVPYAQIKKMPGGMEVQMPN